MTRPHRAALAALLAACSPEGLPPPAHTGAVPLTAPWDALELPVGLGTVTRSDPLGLVVRVDAPAGSAVLVQPWSQALERAGWTREAAVPVPLAAPDRPAFAQETWRRGEARVSLQVRQEGGVAVCSLVAL